MRLQQTSRSLRPDKYACLSTLAVATKATAAGKLIEAVVTKYGEYSEITLPLPVILVH